MATKDESAGLPIAYPLAGGLYWSKPAVGQERPLGLRQAGARGPGRGAEAAGKTDRSLPAGGAREGIGGDEMAIVPMRPKWKGTMTDRERFNRQMHFQSVDRCFNMEFGYWQENFDQWDLFLKNNIRTNEEADVFFNFDRIDVVTGNIWMSPPFENRVVSETADKRVLINGDGLYAEVPKDGHDTIPHYIKPSIVTPEDWRRVKEERFNRDDPARIPDVAAILRQHPADRDYPLGVNCGSMIGRIRDMLTFEGVAYAIYDYPEMLEDMVETACQLVGKVNSFWGGKSLVLGWDSRWGTTMQVTAAGSSSTGTYRPFGMDCSGYVDWVFYNASGGEYIIGHGGGAASQHGYCAAISWDEAMPGDLVFYPEDSHVGIVGGRDESGNLLIIHCASGYNNVVITGIEGFASIGRPVYFPAESHENKNT